MSHHSSDPGMEEAMHEAMRLALGEFPDGKLSPDDEGAIAMAVGHVAGRVKLTFAKPVAWLGLRPQEAVELAQLLIDHAKAASPRDFIIEVKL
jgi:hypothetical protein